MYRIAAAALASSARSSSTSRKLVCRRILSSRNYVAKDINFGTAARVAMLQGVNDPTEADKVTMGPQLKSLLEIKVEWLYYILEAFNSGDFVRYQELCRVHNAARSAQPALVEDEKKLLEKINILCLMEMIIFS